MHDLHESIDIPSGRSRAVYTLSEDQGRLDFEVTVTDPATFTEPAVIKSRWLALRETIPRYDCRAAR